MKNVAEILGVHADTIRVWCAAGIITPSFVTPGGHRRFLDKDLEPIRKMQANLLPQVEVGEVCFLKLSKQQIMQICKEGLTLKLVVDREGTTEEKENKGASDE